MQRTSSYRPGLAWFAAVASAWVFVLVALGAFTTTIGAGMAFSDWPLSNGSANPHGWLTNVSMFAEHSHRLSGTLMGLFTLTLAIWLWRGEARDWMRRLGWWALAVVIIQGVLGGTRVLLDRVAVPGFEMTLGQMLRIPHGILGQVFVCLLFAIAAGLSRSWIEGPARTPAPATRRYGRWCVILIFVQLTIAATMRHNAAGLAIPTFPLSTPAGGLLPAAWDYRVALNFAHRLMALVLTFAIPGYAVTLLRDPGVSRRLRSLGIVLVLLLATQITLGAQIIWTGRSIFMTTGHVVVGALTLATTFLVTFLTHRGSIGSTSP